MRTLFTVLNSAEKKLEDGDSLCLQQVVCPAQYEDQVIFRFIRRSKEGKLKAQKGGAVIFNLDEIKTLVKVMENILEKSEGKASKPPPRKNSPS